MYIHKTLFIVLLCHALHSAYCSYHPEVIFLGDYLEHYLSVPLSCSSITDGKNVTNQINKKFADCTTKISAPAQQPFENFKLICENQEKYLQCWDQLKDDIKTKCQGTRHLPAVYAASVKSFCANDNGNKTISRLVDTVPTVTEEDQKKCAKKTGIHWKESCKPYLEAMISENLCERHSALVACTGKVLCINMQFARTMKQVYTDAKTYLGCDN